MRCKLYTFAELTLKKFLSQNLTNFKGTTIYYNQVEKLRGLGKELIKKHMHKQQNGKIEWSFQQTEVNVQQELKLI